jgi:hypothetical protein
MTDEEIREDHDFGEVLQDNLISIGCSITFSKKARCPKCGAIVRSDEDGLCAECL